MPTRPLRRPLAHPAQKFRAVTVALDGWIRLHWPSKAATFVRDTNHRFTPDKSPVEVLYLARDERTATLEIFGDRLYQNLNVDIPSAEWHMKQYSTVAVPAVNVVDLFSAGGLEAAQVDASALEHNDLAIPQAWALSVMTHAAGFHGLLYGSRFTKRKCLALFSIHGDPRPVVVGPSRAFHRSAAAAHLLKKYHVRIT